MAVRSTVLLVEDHAVVREGLRALLSHDEELTVVGEACNGVDAVRLAEELQPDLVLMDLSLPGLSGVDATSSIKENRPETKVLILTVHKSGTHIRSALEAGADGYVVKESLASEIGDAIRRILRGDKYLGSGVSETVVEGFLGGDKKDDRPEELSRLTARELELLSLIGEGLSTKEIADRIHISPRTVATHRANIMKKLDIHSTGALTAYAHRQGLVSS